MAVNLISGGAGGAAAGSGAGGAMAGAAWPMLLLAGAGVAKEELPGIFGTSKREAEAQRRAITTKYSPWTGQQAATGALPEADPFGAALQGAAIGSMFGGGLGGPKSKFGQPITNPYLIPEGQGYGYRRVNPFLNLGYSR